MKIKILKFVTVIGLIKTSNEFKDECPETSLKVLKTLTSKKLVNKITVQGSK